MVLAFVDRKKPKPETSDYNQKPSTKSAFSIFPAYASLSKLMMASAGRHLPPYAFVSGVFCS